MAQILAGPGLGLPTPQQLYPSILQNVAYAAATNSFSLQSAQVEMIPAGQWLVGFGTQSAVQYLNPVTQQWTNINVVGTAGAVKVDSDGFNFRVNNLTGSAYAATVSVAGSGYVAASTTITPSAGNSTWLPIIGGSITGVTVDTAGTGYGKPPLVFLASPPAPGVAATATAALSGSTVGSITVRTAGAGYVAAPPVVIVTDPTDPNLLAGLAITPATAHATVGGAGTLTAVFLLNWGASQGSGVTLTVNGVGSSATAATVPASGSLVAPANDVITLQPLVGI